VRVYQFRHRGNHHKGKKECSRFFESYKQASLPYYAKMQGTRTFSRDGMD
jgi:hypothetical protein